MRTPDRLRARLLSPVRTRRRAVVSAAVLLATAALAWYGVRAARFDTAYTAAEQALAGYDFPAARDRLRECARLRPRAPAVWLLAAQAARRDGDLDEAAAHLARYQQLEGRSSPDGELEDTLQEAQRGRTEENVHSLIALADSGHPATEQILEALAVGCVQVYHLDRASFWVGELLARFPKNPVGRLILAQTYDTLGRRDRAVEIGRELAADFPGYAKARLHLAVVLYKAQKYDEAAVEYEALRRARPGDVEGVLGGARCLDRMGRGDEARPLMRELEEHHAGNGEAMLECGRFGAREGRFDDAERLLRRAVQLAPNDHEAQYHLGLCLQRLGKTEESRRHLERFKQIEADLTRMEYLLTATVKAPKDPAPRREAGLICLRNGQAAEGMRWLYGVLEIDPNDRATHEALADYFLSSGDPGRSVYHRRRAG
ncbi:MAG: tetratricopeptide repeat protein [Gemmataceae bacterium]|nr:tetratricopeptide repeat protein [Gemmataceae bacterium]